MWIVGVGLCLMLAMAAINGYMVLSTQSRILTMEEAQGMDAECVLVLGTEVLPDGTPSERLEDRLSIGIEAYGRGVGNKLLMSGDHGREDYDEVGAMKAFAIGRDVPSADVFKDHAGFSTYESMYRARDVFQAKKIVIVTQEYHLYRALYNAERMGIEAYGISASLRHYARQPHYDFREYLARVKDFVWGIFQPKPAGLGQPVSLVGDGDVTNDQ